MSSKAKKTVDEERNKVFYRIYVGFSKKNLRTKENLKTTNKITKPFKISVLFLWYERDSVEKKLYL